MENKEIIGQILDQIIDQIIEKNSYVENNNKELTNKEDELHDLEKEFEQIIKGNLKKIDIIDKPENNINNQGNYKRNYQRDNRNYQRDNRNYHRDNRNNYRANQINIIENNQVDEPRNNQAHKPRNNQAHKPRNNQAHEPRNNQAHEPRNNQAREPRNARPERPMVRNDITGEFDIKFASASITFVHSKAGQLHCIEYRWPERYEDGSNVNHLIGGKVEKEDYDILFTAVREFVEETNIFMDKDLINDNSVIRLSKYLYKQVKSKTKYHDIKVSERNNLYHRCYIFNVNKFTNIIYRNKILGLPVFYNKLLNPDTRINKELTSLKWMIENEIKSTEEQDQSSLFKTYVKNLDNFV